MILIIHTFVLLKLIILNTNIKKGNYSNICILKILLYFKLLNLIELFFLYTDFKQALLQDPDLTKPFIILFYSANN